jgi:hypothetical protein
MSTKTRIPAKFLSVEQFKQKTNSSTLEVVFNNNTNKLVLLADESDFYKVQQNIDESLPMAFILPDYIIEKDGTQRPSTIDDACLINVSKKESPLVHKFTL